MTTAYTSLLGLALPTTGELQGTWGDTVNNSITSLVDSAVAGTTTLSTDLDVTLSTTTGAANQARQAILLCSGARTAIRTITAPAQSKIYTVINATTGGYSVKVVGVGPTTGVTVIAGESAQIAWNGSDFIKISNTAGAGVFSSITNTGLTSGRVVYSTTGGLETDSANLLYSGTDLTVYGITVGRGAGAVSTNTAVGASALAANTTGDRNTAAGYQALTSVTTSTQHSAFGYRALTSNTSGQASTAFGKDTLRANTTGSENTAVGNTTLDANTTGSYNVGIGAQALINNTTASNNTAVGYQAIYTNTTGAELTAIGNQALQKNTTANWNIAVGSYSLKETTTGAANTAIGYSALQYNTTASYNTAVGHQAGYSVTTGTYNCFLGRIAGYASTGAANCFVGANAGYAMTSGNNNTIIGSYSGNQGGLDIRTASNYIVLSDGDGNPRAQWDGSGNLKSVANICSYRSNSGSLASGATRTLFSFPNGSYGSVVSGTVAVLVRDDNNGNLQTKVFLVTGFGGAGANFDAISSQPYGAGMPFTLGVTASSGSLVVSITNNSANSATSVYMATNFLYGGDTVTYGF